MKNKFFISFFISILTLACFKEYLIPYLINSKISEKIPDLVINATISQIFLISLLLAIVVMLSASGNKKFRKVVLTVLVLCLIGVGGYFTVRSFVDYVKKPTQVTTTTQKIPQNNVTNFKPAIQKQENYSVVLKKGENILDGYYNSIEYTPKPGHLLRIIPGTGLELQIGTGKKIKVEPDANGNAKINITQNKFYECLKIYSNQQKTVEIQIFY